jgi:hypothetical protein
LFLRHSSTSGLQKLGITTSPSALGVAEEFIDIVSPLVEGGLVDTGVENKVGETEVIGGGGTITDGGTFS